MADSDSDDILSGDFLEPGELLDSDDEQLDTNSTSARTSQPVPLNRPKVSAALGFKLEYFRLVAIYMLLYLCVCVCVCAH